MTHRPSFRDFRWDKGYTITGYALLIFLVVLLAATGMSTYSEDKVTWPPRIYWVVDGGLVVAWVVNRVIAKVKYNQMMKGR